MTEKENTQTNMVEDIDIEDTSSEQDMISNPFNPNDVKIISPPYNISNLMDRLEYGDINMQTDFQRLGNLWDPIKQSRLIESILLGLPLPAFYFDTSSDKWNIIDGLQRCCAIENFCITKTLKLQGLEFLNQFESFAYDDFDVNIQRKIKTCSITVHQVQKGSPLEVRYILFKRLNTGGLDLTPQEIRNAMFQGKVSDIIKKMSTSKLFMKATNEKIPVKRMQDQDFVTRFIAFYLTSFEDYQPDLDGFLIKNLEILNKKSKDEYLQLENDFYKALSLANKIFKDDAFRKRTEKKGAKGRINKAYFEVITSTFANLSDEEAYLLLQRKEEFKDALIELANQEDQKFIKAISSATGTRESVVRRFSDFRNVVNKYIHKQ